MDSASISISPLTVCMPMRQKATTLYPHSLVTISKCSSDHESAINGRDEGKDWYQRVHLLTEFNFL